MGTFFKWLLGLILFLVVLLVAAVVVLPMVIDPNDYKPQIVAAVKEQTGRDLAIERELSLSVFPWLGIQTGGVRLGNAAGFEADSFAEVDELGVKVKVMPLLSRRVEIDTLVVKGLRLNLEKNAKGVTNWEDLAKGEAQAKAEAPAETPAEEAGAPAMALSVQGIQIEDARISWDDRQAGQQYVLDGVRLVTGSLEPGATVPVEAGVRFTSSQPAMTLDAELQADVSSNAALTVFKVAGLVLQLDAEGEGLPAGGAELTLKADLEADTGAGTLNVQGLNISGPAMEASGSLAVTGLQASPAVKGQLAIAETNPKTLASMFANPIETVDPQALTKASGELAFQFGDGALKLDPLTLRLDESSLTGYVNLLDFAAPVVRTKLELDQIDLDRYMPPPGEPAATAGADSAADQDAQPGDPFAALRTLDLVGEFRVGKLKVSNARMSNVAAKVVSKDGILKVDPMAAELYEGRFDGRVVVNAKKKKPRLKLANTLKGIQIGPLLKDVAGQDRLVGSGDLNMDIGMVGMTEQDIRRSLDGSAGFTFKNGALKGVNLAQIIREASSRLGLGGDKLETGTPGQTDFSEMSASVKITDGVIRNDDLQAKSPLLRITGKGEVDLPGNTVDYLVVTELVGTLEGQGGKERGELAGVPIPVRVTGPLTGPSYRPDLEAALSAKAKAQLEEKKQELQDKVQDKAKGKLDDALKGLFNR